MVVDAVMSREARGAKTAGPVGIHHGFLLFRRVAQATVSVGLQNGFVHRCHRLVNYDAYEIHLPESSVGAWDHAYVVKHVVPRAILNLVDRPHHNACGARCFDA